MKKIGNILGNEKNWEYFREWKRKTYEEFHFGWFEDLRVRFQVLMWVWRAWMKETFLLIHAFIPRVEKIWEKEEREKERKRREKKKVWVWKWKLG